MHCRCVYVCLYMHACMYVCNMCVCMYVCTHERLSVVKGRSHALQVCVCVYTFICIYVCVCVYDMCMYVLMRGSP
jgi:hypothetical protein